MAVILTGDFDFDKTIQIVDNTFGTLEKKEGFKLPELPKEEPIKNIRKVEIFDNNEPSLALAFRYDGVNSIANDYIELINKILANSYAGLFDTQLKGNLKVKDVKSSNIKQQDYGLHYIEGFPNEGQSLEEVESLIIEQIDRIKKGDFEEWLLTAIINEFKVNDNKNYTDKWVGSDFIADTFVYNQSWLDRITYTDRLSKITKQQIVDFANEFYKDNYVIAYKKKGNTDSPIKVEKPKITPLADTSNKISDFATKLNSIPLGKLEAEFVDFDKNISLSTLDSDVSLASIKNKQNSDFELDIIFNTGRIQNKELGLSMALINQMGAGNLSSNELKQEFYKYGIKTNFSIRSDETVFHIEGLEENLEHGLAILNNFLDNPTLDQSIFKEFIDNTIEKRKSTISKGRLFYALQNYAQYGNRSPIKNIVPVPELKQLTAEDITNKIKKLKEYQAEIFYYGKSDIKSMKALLEENYKILKPLTKVDPKNEYPLKSPQQKIYFANFEMAQAQIALLSRGPLFDLKNIPFSNLLNSYVQDILKEEIREKRALAYSTWCYYADATTTNSHDYFKIYAGTQGDKCIDAVDIMVKIFNELPKNENKFDGIKENKLHRFESIITRKSDMYWVFRDARKKGANHDLDKDRYEKIKTITLEELASNYKKNISENGYDIIIVGDKDKIDLKALSKYGEVIELSQQELFGAN